LRFSGRLAEFWYGDSFLKKGYALDPLRLPLTRQVFSADGLQGDLGVFGDALPDSWGRYLIKRQQGRVLPDLEMLILDSSTQRMGALFFSPNLNQKPSDKAHTLDWMHQFSAWLNDNSKSFPEHMEYGSSAGGAKPKCLVNVDNLEWIAKFQSGNELLSIPAIEHGTLKLALACDIPVSDSRLIDLPDGKQVILIKRFDRSLREPLHYLSAHTLCNVQLNESGQAINDTRSYLILADILSQMSSQPKQDRADLFRRIVFNILINNHDDHVKNHGVIKSEKGQWRLSPAFDLVAGEGASRDLAMEIGPDGCKATLSNLMQSLASFGLKKSQALDEINSILKILKNWKRIFEKAGVNEKAVNDIAWAIQDDVDVSRL
jgi:serine/threonine-protein kinase HipA